MDKLENSKVLKDIGLDEKNKWILHEEKAQKFFEFIANNVDNSNILTNSELFEHEKLIEAGKVLNDEELERELKNIEESFPGFFSVNDDELDELEAEVKKLEADINERSDRLSRIKDFEGEQLKTITELERINSEVALKERLLTEECLKRSSELESLQETNSKEVAQLDKIYTQPQSSPTIMSQMPLDLYFAKCNELLRLLEIYMTQNFNICKRNEDMYNPEDESDINSLYKIKVEIIKMQKKKFEEEMSVAGMNYVIENIDKYKNYITSDFFEMKSVIDSLILEKESLEAHLNGLMLEGNLILKDTAEQKVTKILHEYFIGKNKRVTNRAEKITQVHEITDYIAYVCELMWAACQMDINRLKNRVDNSSEMNNQSQQCMKRIRQMKQLSIVDHSFYSHQFLKSFQKLLIENIHCDKNELSSIEKCFMEYINHGVQVNAVMQMLIEQKHYNKIQKTIKMIDEQSSILRDLIFCGPTNKPRLYDPKFIVPLHEKQSKKKEFEKIFQELKYNFQTKIIQPYSNDKFYRMKELLYIWFCSEPKKVLLAIKEVQKKAAEEGSASYKALNITVSH
ncbi:hypothetical protein ACKWTF_006383 [Chironomus riparius]